MYAILRMEKLKNRQQIKSALLHNFRKISVENSDQNLEKFNVYMGADNFPNFVEKLEKKFEKYNINPKKDAVLAVEFVLTASPEFFKNKTDEEIKSWSDANLNFFVKKYSKNLLNFTLHRDETTPHIHIIMTPITNDGRLSCKDLFGGKANLSKLQTEYSAAMSEFGLKRGKQYSGAKHTTVKQFYTLANKIKKLTNEQLKKLADLISEFEFENDLSKEIDAELNLQLLKSINKVKPLLKNIQ